MKNLSNLEIFTVEIEDVSAILSKFNLFYYLSTSKYLDEFYDLLGLLSLLEKNEYKIVRFNGWLLLRVDGINCRLSLKRLNTFIQGLNIKES